MEVDNILIEVAYATPDKQVVIPLTVASGTSVFAAIEQSQIIAQFAELNLTSLPPVGIYGKKIDIGSYTLQDGDRIEIYRPLNKTPNQKRLERVKNL